MYIKKKSESENENNIFWVTMTDLMTALVLVFMVLFFYMFITGYQEKIERDTQKYTASKELEKTLSQQNINATIDAISGVVKIGDLELFELNSYKLSEKGKQYLAKFAPAYLDSLFKNEYLRDNIDKIIIQGHTDSQTFAGEYSADQQYMKNMELSLKRAYTVAEYMVNTPYDKLNGDKLRKMIIVEGASFSNPILDTNGKEDFSKSRRVELKIIMKENSKMKDSLDFSSNKSK